MKVQAFFRFAQLLFALALALRAGDAPAQSQPAPQVLEVMHWWTSDGEHKAAAQLAAGFAANGLKWQDAAVAGGGGIAAVKVLKSRVLMGDPPDVAQLIGSTLGEWAQAGLVYDLSAMAARQRWSQNLHPLAMELITQQNRIVAAPLGIHRINTLLFNRKLFEKAGLTPPRNWSEFEAAVAAFQRMGIQPLAWSDEPWQLATVFEAVLLGEAGAQGYIDLIKLRGNAAWSAPRAQASVSRALTRLQTLRQSSGKTFAESPWVDGVRQLKEGNAAMLIMGDWAAGELVAWGADPERDFGCVAVPGTQGMHLYSIDTLAMLVNPRHNSAGLEKAAQTIVSPAVQVAYNSAKGSIPVRRDTKPELLDSCARNSWESFTMRDAKRVPSLAHRMAADDATKDAVAQILWRYLTQNNMNTATAQQRLATVLRKPFP